jgi:hypothetical protein
MADPRALDVLLDRLSKLGGISVPVIIFVLGSNYTRHKDRNDDALRIAQEQRDKDQKNFDNTQKKYANLSALLPLLTSGKEDQVQVGLEIYKSEANAFQAPTDDLQDWIGSLKKQFPKQANLVQLATDAGQRQQVAECKVSANGIYVQVANDPTQLNLGKSLADQLSKSGISPRVQGVQRIDKGPQSTELRYYSSKTNDTQADEIISKLRSVGIMPVAKVDLTQRYLKPGCQPPAVYELWIGTSSPLVQH